MAGAAILLLSAVLLVLIRLNRRRWVRRRQGGDGRVRTSLKDAWSESGDRMPSDPSAPRERNPDDDLPSLGGRS